MDMVCRMAANTGPAQTAAAAVPAARLVAAAAGQAAAGGSEASEETADVASASLGFPADAPEAILAALTQELRSQSIDPSTATAGMSGETRPQSGQAACLQEGGLQGFARQGPARRSGINSPRQELVNESRGREGLGDHSDGGSSRVAALLERVRAAQADLDYSSSDRVIVR